MTRPLISFSLTSEMCFAILTILWIFPMHVGSMKDRRTPMSLLATNVGFDVVKAMEELFGRKKVSFTDKHVNSGNLSVKFEVYLKKLYYMVHGEEIKAQNEGDKVTLATCIFAFPCLKKLRWSTKETEQKLSGYLDIIRNTRNTDEGNGAHSSYLMTEEQLDSNIKAFVTLYLYVTGMCLNDIKVNYSI